MVNSLSFLDGEFGLYVKSVALKGKVVWWLSCLSRLKPGMEAKTRFCTYISFRWMNSSQKVICSNQTHLQNKQQQQQQKMMINRFKQMHVWYKITENFLFHIIQRYSLFAHKYSKFNKKRILSGSDWWEICLNQLHCESDHPSRDLMLHGIFSDLF